MLSFKALGGGRGGRSAGAAADYYERDAKADGRSHDEYVAREQAPVEPRWYSADPAAADARFPGDGAEVRPGELRDALNGLGRDGSELAQDAKRGARLAGYDLTFSPPKDFSVLYAAGDAETRRGMADDLRESAVAGFRAMHEAGVFETRRGRDGAEREQPAQVSAAAYVHSTNRDAQPQAHAHVVVPNAVLRRDGTTGTMDAWRNIARWQSYGGAVFRAELADRLERRGLGIEKEGQFFRVAGVPRDLAEAWSGRSRTIRAASKKAAGASAVERLRARKDAGLKTRSPKAAAPADPEGRWRRDMAERGHSPEGVWKGAREAARGLERPGRDIGAEAVQTALERRSVATERELRRLVAEAVQTAGGGAEAVKRESDRLLGGGSGLVELGRTADGERAFSTRDVLDRERRMLLNAVERRAEASPFRAEAVEAALAARPSLSAEQAGAVRHAAGRGGVAAVEGLAGTGKSFALGAVAEAARDSGLRVHALAPSWQAAKVVGADTGERGRTIQGLARALDAGRVRLGRGDVVLLDEAGMASSKDADRLLGHARQGGARVVMVGDRGQLRSVEPGNAFAAVADELGPARMTEVRRQGRAWQREASQAFGRGEGAEAMAAYAERGRVRFAEDRAAGINAAAEAWEKNRAAHPAASRLVLAGRNEDVRAVNEAIRGRLLAAGELGAESMVVRTLHSGGRSGEGVARETELRPGDRLAIGAKLDTGGRDVLRNDTGTLQGFTRGADPALTVLIDRTGKAETFRLSELARPAGKGEQAGERLPQLQHGYASTVHKSQAQTVDFTVVYGGRGLDARQGYVAMTRHRRDVVVVADGGGLRERMAGNGKIGEAELRAAFAGAAGRSDRGGNAADLVADKRAWLRTGDPLARGERQRGVAIGLNLAGRAAEWTKAAARRLGERLGVVRERDTPERQKLRAAARAARARREEQERERRPAPEPRGSVAPREQGGGRSFGYSVRGQAIPVQGQDMPRDRYHGHER